MSLMTKKIEGSKVTIDNEERDEYNESFEKEEMDDKLTEMKKLDMTPGFDNLENASYESFQGYEGRNPLESPYADYYSSSMIPKEGTKDEFDCDNFTDSVKTNLKSSRRNETNLTEGSYPDFYNSDQNPRAIRKDGYDSDYRENNERVDDAPKSSRLEDSYSDNHNRINVIPKSIIKKEVHYENNSETVEINQEVRKENPSFKSQTDGMLFYNEQVLPVVRAVSKLPPINPDLLTDKTLLKDPNQPENRNKVLGPLAYRIKSATNRPMTGLNRATTAKNRPMTANSFQEQENPSSRVYKIKNWVKNHKAIVILIIVGSICLFIGKFLIPVYFEFLL